MVGETPAVPLLSAALGRENSEGGRHPMGLLSVFTHLWPRRRYPGACTWVTPDLALGRAPASAATLVAAGVGAVLDVRAESPTPELAALRQAGIRTLRLPVAQGHSPTAEQLELAVTWAGERLAEGRRLLIRCSDGVTRSSPVAMAVLIARGEQPARAYELVVTNCPAVRAAGPALERLLARARHPECRR